MNYRFSHAVFYRNSFPKDFPVPKGIAKGLVVKYGMGMPILLLAILIIWGPLLIFASVNSIGRRSLPTHAKLTISIEGYPVY